MKFRHLHSIKEVPYGLFTLHVQLDFTIGDPKEHLYELEKWNKIFFPFYYGVGIEKFSLPRIFSPFHPASVMIGHCGSTGAVAFYIPKEQLYITGTINQQAKPNVAFQTMIGIIQATKKAVL